MDNNIKSIERLMNRNMGFGNIDIEPIKFKAITNSSGIVSATFPNSIMFIMTSMILFFLSFALAFWLGVIIGETWIGLSLVAAACTISVFVIHFFNHDWLKNSISNYIFKHGLK